ncbi:glycosyltransferase [bacterium]|nr:glycosyltransferase [bacterium]
MELAVGLKKQGNDVYMAYYIHKPFFEPILASAGIKMIIFKERCKLDRIYNLHKTIKAIKPDIVQAYLHGPSMVAEIVSMIPGKWKLVVSERNIYNAQHHSRPSYIIGRQLHRLADSIVMNSYANRDLLCDLAPFLRKKTEVIWNCVDLDRFHPPEEPPSSNKNKPFEFVCVASMAPAKNAPMVVKALSILKNFTDRSFRLHWIGTPHKEDPDTINTFNKTMELVKKNNLEDVFVFEGAKTNVEDYLKESNALVLCSQYEGLPNAICEGMASGLPIVASRVSDNEMFVGESKNGFLCDPNDVESIAASLKKCLELTDTEHKSYGYESRQRAEKMFSRERFLSQYNGIYKRLIK